MKILTKEFFERPVLKVAPELLGKYLVRRMGRKTVRFMITDVEAYDGTQDKASHARFGLTKRNSSMFEQGGVWYVYFTYGMHWLLNIVCGKKGRPAAILIRGIEPTEPRAITFAAARVVSKPLFNGPARITKALKIDKKFNSKVALPETGLWIEQNSKIENCKLKIVNSPRVGVSYAGPIWSKKKWRFVLISKK